MELCLYRLVVRVVQNRDYYVDSGSESGRPSTSDSSGFEGRVRSGEARVARLRLPLLRVDESVGARILLDFDAGAEKIRNEIVRLQRGPSRRATASGAASVSFPTERTEPRPQLVVACPRCATAIQTVTISERNANLQVSIQGSHTCPGCRRRWTIIITAAWTDPSPPADPQDDLGSEMTVWHYSRPSLFSMYRFRCDHVLVRVTPDQTTNPALQVKADDDRTCPGCGRPWRISYTVSWKERPSESFPRRSN
jgi:hypothetical protein